MDTKGFMIDAGLLGKNIRQRREELGYSQQYLAEKAALSTSNISRVECGSRMPQLGTLASIAVALDISVDKLIGSSVQIPPEFSSVLSDCSMAERQIILGTIIALKSGLRDSK